MPEIVITTRDGEEKSIAYTSGVSLMQAICEGGVDELLALCGGMCSCATCHVHIDSQFTTQMEPVSEDEDTLLSGSEHRRDNSRLSCQIMMTDEFDGMKLAIAPED